MDVVSDVSNMLYFFTIGDVDCSFCFGVECLIGELIVEHAVSVSVLLDDAQGMCMGDVAFSI